MGVMGGHISVIYHIGFHSTLESQGVGSLVAVVVEP